MEFFSMIGVLLGVFSIVYLILKGMPVMIAAPLATSLVLVFSSMDLFTYLLGSESNHYMGALGAYLINFFPIFLLGAILAKLMEDSGATTSIAEFILRRVGVDKPYRVMVAIFLIGLILTYGGISIFVVMFTIIPLARTLFQKMNISWRLIQIPLWLGIGCITVTMLPGTPSIHNVIPIQFLNTSLTAAMFPSLVGAIGCAIFGLFYMKVELRKSLKNGEIFSSIYAVEVPETREVNSLPSFFMSLLPLLVLMLMITLGSTFGSDFIQANIIYIALVGSISLAFLLLSPYLSQKMETLRSATNGAISAIFATASAVAFGSVIVGTPGFSVFFEWILEIPGNPLISLVALTALLSGVTGSSSGTLGIVMPNFAAYYLEAGVHPELIHRVAAIGSNITTHVPQSGVFVMFLSLSKLNFKEGYKEGFIVISIGSLIAVTLVILLDSFMY